MRRLKFMTKINLIKLYNFLNFRGLITLIKFLCQGFLIINQFMNNSQQIFKVQQVINFEIEQKKRFIKTLLITNLTDSVIQFNIKTNKLQKYNVRPAQGKIFRKDDHKITITRQPLQQHQLLQFKKNPNTSPNEKFKIKCELVYEDQFGRQTIKIQQKTVCVKFSVKSDTTIGASTNQLQQPKAVFISPNPIESEQQLKKKNEELKILMQDVSKLQNEVGMSQQIKERANIRIVKKVIEFSKEQIISLICFILIFTFSFVD